VGGKAAAGLISASVFAGSPSTTGLSA